MGASARTNLLRGRYVDVDIPSSPLSRRVWGEGSLLQGLPPVIATLVAEQGCVNNGGHSVNGPTPSDDG